MDTKMSGMMANIEMLIFQIDFFCDVPAETAIDIPTQISSAAQVASIPNRQHF